MDRSSFSLESLPPSDSFCPFCGKNDQLVSHGYVYKHKSIDQQEIVGKRILCSQRYGRSGCGRTHQWYLADIVPQRKHRLSVFIAFIHALLSGCTVEHAYLEALDFPPQAPRHAWRWLQSFLRQLARWRVCLSPAAETLVVSQRSSALKILLPTLQILVDRLVNLSCFQTQFQHAVC